MKQSKRVERSKIKRRQKILHDIKIRRRRKEIYNSLVDQIGTYKKPAMWKIIRWRIINTIKILYDKIKNKTMEYTKKR